MTETTAPLIYKQIAAVMKDIPAIGKTKRNAQQGFNYRGIDDVQNALQNILPKYGVFYVPEVLESTREERQTKSGNNLIYSVLKVRYTFYAEDGSSISAVVQSEGMDSADKSSTKAMSAACKYALFQVFNIPTEEQIDPDAVTPEESAPTAKVSPAPKPAEEFDEDLFLERFQGVTQEHTKMTADAAEKVEDSEGVPYGLIPTKEIRVRLNALVRALTKNGLTPEEKLQKQFKLGVINAVLLDRKEHPEKRSNRQA